MSREQEIRERVEKAKRTPDLEWARDLVYGLADDALWLLAELEQERASLLQANLRAIRLRDYLHDEEGLWHSAIDDIERAIASSAGGETG